MHRRPWFLVLGAFVVGVLAIVAALGHVRFYAASSRLPERGVAVERVIGCEDRVQVLLDARGIAHIEAVSSHDAFFAMGYVHARDRFFQMELSRRLAGGRLAELFGEAALGSDRSMRILRLGATARRQLAQLSDEERFALAAYSDGVNAALDHYGRWIAPEMWLLGVDPEIWTPEDSLSVGVLLQLNLSWAMGEELQRSVILAHLGQNLSVDLWGWTPRQARSWLPTVEPPATPRQEGEPFTEEMSGGGSNAWAVAPALSATGRPLLANDPHLGVATPAVWYAIHLRAPDLHVAGLSVPGLPAVAIGHTDGVAWGFTMSMLDDQDLYVLALDETRTRELIDGVWSPLRTVTESIKVRWRDAPEQLKVRMSERGPLLRESGSEVIALSWSGHSGPSSFRAFLTMARSQDVAAAAAAWEGVTGPSMNLIAADVDGRILHQVVGLQPDRGRGAGRLAAPGSDSSWAWRGFLPLAANPQKVDPQEGFVATANHDLFSEGDYPTLRSFPGEFMSPWRIRRIRSVLASRSDWTVTDMLDLQRDVVSGRAIAVLKQLWSELEAHDGATSQRLRSWDGSMARDSVPAHLYSRLLLELREEIGGDEALRAGLKNSPIGPEEVLRLLAGGLDDKWWDDYTTEDVEDMGAIVVRCLDRLDRDRFPAPWGAVHQLSFRHPLADFPLIGPVIRIAGCRGPIPVPGDGVTVHATHFSQDDPFETTIIPSMRFVADVGNWDEGILVLPPGQSGRMWSSHYADQLQPWLEGGGGRLAFSRQAVLEDAVAELVLLPRRDRR